MTARSLIRGLAGPARALGLSFAAALLFGQHASAQTESRPPFSADRPGLGDRAAVMREGLWQAELGATIRAEESDEFLLGSALLRTGFAGVEARFVIPSGLIRHEGSFLQLGDLGVGVKVPLELGGAWWSWAAQGTLTLPTGSDEVSTGEAGGDAAFIAQVELAGDVSLAMNAGYGFLFDDVVGGTGSLVVTPAFPFPGSSDLRAYLGLATYVRSGDDDLVVEWGLTRMEGADRQWDLNAGYDPGSHVWFLGVGVAERRVW
ncbi:MAG TPA: transporter [Longimicrobiales bacterium]|nr:transporter [Longimicrobiales bacterium]